MRTSYLNRIIGVLGTLLVLLAFSACNPQNEAPGEATLTVSVEDATSKLIGPDADNVDISHYRITVSNDNGAIAVSDLLPKNNAYTLTGLVPGEWDILAEGYVKPDASTEAVRVAGKSESTQLTAGSNPVKITLDKLDETPAGTVSITLLLPPEAVSGGSFQYWYSVVDMAGEEAMSSGSEMAPLTGTCTENTGTFDITGINQGSYLLFVSVNTSEGVVTAVDAMRLIAGLDAVGTLDFSGSSNTPTLDTGLTVEDAIGNILVFGDLDGTVFNITGADLELGLPNAYEYHWYLDGSEWDGYVSETEKGESETTFAVGNLEGISATRHVLSVVAVIPGTQIGVGSVELIVNKVGLTIEENIEGFDIIPDGEFTLGGMVFKDSVFIPKGKWNSIAFVGLDESGEIYSAPTGSSDSQPSFMYLGMSPVSSRVMAQAVLFKEMGLPEEELGEVAYIINDYLEPFENGRLPSSFLLFPGVFYSQEMTVGQFEMLVSQGSQAGINLSLAAVCYNSEFNIDPSSSETELLEELMFSIENCGTEFYDPALFKDNLSSFFSLTGNSGIFPFTITGRDIAWDAEFYAAYSDMIRENNIRYKGLVISGEENSLAFNEKLAEIFKEKDSDARFDMIVSLVEENSDKIIDLPGTIGGNDKTAVVYPLIYMTGADGTEKFCYDFQDPQNINMTGFRVIRDSGLPAYCITGIEDWYVQDDPAEFVIPDSICGINVKKIDPYAFYDEARLTGRLVLPEGLESIGSHAFYGCNGLTSVDIPDGVTTIGEAAFKNCSKLESITIPGSVIEIDSGYYGYGAFDGCSGLTSVTILDGVTSIGENMFRDCSNITNITIPGSVSSIEEGAFYRCGGLMSVTILDGVTSIGEHVFNSCSSLTSVNIPDTVTSIGQYAFRGCSSLININIPDGITKIASGTFNECSSLTNIDIPKSVTSIGLNAFRECNGLISVTVPDSVTYIGAGAFQSCRNLASVIIPDSVTEIDSLAFSGCSSLTSIDIPDGVKSIYGDAFKGCSGLTSIDIPEGVTLIGGPAFSGCSSLTSIDIPNSVTEIRQQAFEGCSGLTSIIIPVSVIDVEQNLFGGCSALSDIYCEALVQPEDWDSNWLSECNADVFWGISRAEYEAIMNNDSVPYEVPEPVISVNADVTISCDKAFAHIYYTIDGSEPTKDNGTLYEGPFSLADGFTVKAVAYVGSGIYSAIAESSGE